jgi:23S rRNA pseudouridine2605 synthase
MNAPSKRGGPASDDREAKPGGLNRPRSEAADDEAGRGERIAKWLARAGVASRRDAEKIIAEGRVRLNRDPVTQPATFVQPGDVVTVDNKPVHEPERTRLFRYHKPAG